MLGYAYIEIALFGKSYLNGAKDAWRLLKDRGIDALINDSIVGVSWLFSLRAVTDFLARRLYGPSAHSWLADSAASSRIYMST